MFLSETFYLFNELDLGNMMMCVIYNFEGNNFFSTVKSNWDS